MANGDLKHAAQERIDAAVERGFPGQVLFFKHSRTQNPNRSVSFAFMQKHTHTQTLYSTQQCVRKWFYLYRAKYFVFYLALSRTFILSFLDC